MQFDVPRVTDEVRFDVPHATEELRFDIPHVTEEVQCDNFNVFFVCCVADVVCRPTDNGVKMFF